MVKEKTDVKALTRLWRLKKAQCQGAAFPNVAPFCHLLLRRKNHEKDCSDSERRQGIFSIFS